MPRFLLILSKHLFKSWVYFLWKGQFVLFFLICVLVSYFFNGVHSLSSSLSTICCLRFETTRSSCRYTILRSHTARTTFVSVKNVSRWSSQFMTRFLIQVLQSLLFATFMTILFHYFHLLHLMLFSELCFIQQVKNSLHILEVKGNSFLK